MSPVELPSRLANNEPTYIAGKGKALGVGGKDTRTLIEQE